MADVAAPALPRAFSEKLARPRHRTASFGDLVHTRWHHKANPADEHARQAYDEVRALFEDEHGKIVDDYL
jgi:hypothetical protein